MQGYPFRLPVSCTSPFEGTRTSPSYPGRDLGLADNHTSPPMENHETFAHRYPLISWASFVRQNFPPPFLLTADILTETPILLPATSQPISLFDA